MRRGVFSNKLSSSSSCAVPCVASWFRVHLPCRHICLDLAAVNPRQLANTRVANFGRAEPLPSAKTINGRWEQLPSARRENQGSGLLVFIDNPYIYTYPSSRVTRTSLAKVIQLDSRGTHVCNLLTLQCSPRQPIQLSMLAKYGSMVGS